MFMTRWMKQPGKKRQISFGAGKNVSEHKDYGGVEVALAVGSESASRRCVSARICFAVRPSDNRTGGFRYAVVRQSCMCQLAGGVLVFDVAAPGAKGGELVERALSIGLDGNEMLFLLRA